MMRFTAVLVVILAGAANAAVPVINGTQVSAADYPMVVETKFDSSLCSGVLIGPRVVATAAHCVGQSNRPGKVKIGNKIYNVDFTRSPLYPDKDHDIAIGVSRVNFKAAPSSIAEVYKIKDSVTIVGLGCTKTSGSDLMLASGSAEISDIEPMFLVTRGASALCFGDSGAPALVQDGDKVVVAGIGSKGNIKDASWFTRFDTAETESLFDQVIAEKNVEICGYNADCK